MHESGNQSSSQKTKHFAALARRLSRLPNEKKKVSLEMSASLAAVSLKVSREFVEAVPKAAKILSEENLRAWAELGRKVAMADADLGSAYFAKGVGKLRRISKTGRTLVFKISTRQLVLSSSIALETFEFIPELAKKVDDDELLEDILELALEISTRSAKHSADFLHATPDVAKALKKFGKNKKKVSKATIKLAAQFASRTGGMTADLWSGLPVTFEKLSAKNAILLMTSAGRFLEYGGSVTLHFVGSGSKILERFDPVFDEWTEVLQQFAAHGNAVLISFLRSSPQFFKRIGSLKSKKDAIGISGRILELVREIAVSDPESALAAFRSSTKALRKVSLKQFEEWVETGLATQGDASQKARRSFFALETRQSNELLQDAQEGLPLENIQTILRIYIEGLTGKQVEIAPLSAMPQESRIGDGKIIYLPSKVDEFADAELDFRLYKVLAAHGAGQIEFGTFVSDTDDLKAAYSELNELYTASADQLDAFSLAGYIEEVQKGEKALSEEEFRREFEKNKKRIPDDPDYKAVLQVFPEPRLARRIFGTMENARIDLKLRQNYRGLVKDLDLMQEFLGRRRPYIFDLPVDQVPFELLFQITMCGGATADAKQFYGQVVSEIESVIERYLKQGINRRDAEAQGKEKFLENETEGLKEPIKSSAPLRPGGEESFPTVADSIIATSRVYDLFQNVSPEETQAEESDNKDEKGEYAKEDVHGEAVTEEQIKREEKPKEAVDIRDLFNAWNDHQEDDGEPEDLQGSENWAFSEMPEQPLEAGDEAFSYDEWDRELNDFRTGWCRVIEKNVRRGDRNFVEQVRANYRGVISSVRHQFQLLKPENLTKINRELDGEDYDLNAVIDHVVDRRADGYQSERLYTKRLRRERDVAVSLLLDQSSSTARTITRNPLQPYTHPGRRIIEIEKEGLVLMSEALEAVGDLYAINGFTSEGRRNVKFYIVKDFGEKYSEEIEKRIGGITFQNNTRLGAAIRHAAAKLLKQESRTKLMIILTDGRPYDHDYGDAKYAKEDVREALTEARMSGITPFCITIDRDSEQELKDLYGEVGYTIIDDVLSLPEKLPNIYRRLTS
ncbi:MAG: VWA domain-containing protein [Pyrinomonadaceae bacterium]